VLIESHVSSVVWGTTPKPVTEPQSGLLRQLGHSGAVDSRTIASAWIEHYYATRCADALKRWKPMRGDVVTLQHDRLDVATGELYRTTTEGAISSIGDSGLIYFRGGNGKRHGGRTVTSGPAQPSQKSLATNLEVMSNLFASVPDANMLMLTPTLGPVTLASRTAHLQPILRQSGWT
jgi:hypothetical protein